MLAGRTEATLTCHTRIAVVVRHFSTAGGLELYAHKIVEGLLQKGLNVTVLCQQNESTLTYRNLKVVEFGALGQMSGSKRQQLSELFVSATEAIKKHGPFDIIHSQHCPVIGANVVTFHNHTTARLSRIGLPAEQRLNDLKRFFVPAYKMRQQHDEALCRSAGCLIFPAEVMQQDFFQTFPFLAQANIPYVVAHPGADLCLTSSDSNASTLAPVTVFPDSAGSLETSWGPGHPPSRDNVASRHTSPAEADTARFNFLFVGRGFRKKGLDVLLSACRILKSRDPNFTLSIAGLKEKPFDRLRLQFMGLATNVQYLGFCKDMDSVYRRCSVLVLPSRVEPFGMAPVQAMQRGLVPIVSQVSGVAEVLTHEHDSLLLRDHLSAPELANLMQRLMTSGEFREKLSANAKHTATKVSWNAAVDQTLRAYELALNGRDQAATGTESTSVLIGTGSHH